MRGGRDGGAYVRLRASVARRPDDVDDGSIFDGMVSMMRTRCDWALTVCMCILPLAGLHGRAEAQTDVTPPRLLSISPSPAAGVVDQRGLAEVTIAFSEPGDPRRKSGACVGRCIRRARTSGQL